MLIQKKFNYITLTRQQNDNGFRTYNTPDGKQVASVTTIISQVADMSHIEAWQKRIGIEEANRIRDEAADLGSKMHNNLERYILGERMTGYHLSQALAKVIVRHGLSQVNEIWGSEVSLYSPELWAGTTDIVGLYKNKPAIIDFKNSLKEKKVDQIDGYRAQLAAYSLAHDELFGTNIRCLVVMIATREGKYQEFVFEGKEYTKCVDLWLRTLEKYYTPINK